ncbi:hypothetical protein EDB19DRAFT_1613506, partial [Suillus lakei]
QSTMHGTNNSEDFWEDIYDLPMADYLRQYEQWACTQNKNLNECDSLETVHKQVRKLIVHGLSMCYINWNANIVMNYISYETAVVEAYAVRLTGWPQSVKFISPSNIGMVAEIWKLCDALKVHTCYWAVLTPGEVKAHLAELDACHCEVVHQPCKKCSDAGVSCK